MLEVLLVVVNIPIFLLVGWVVFDTKEGAVDTFWATFVTLLKQLFVPRLMRAMLGWDEEGALGIFPIAFFFLVCGCILYAQWMLFKQWGF